MPRVTVKRFQPLDGLAKRTRLQLQVRVPDEQLIGSVAAELSAHRGSNGLVRIALPVSNGRIATFLVGQDFALDADLAMRLERLLGEGQVELSAPPKLALVG
jgi:DNA polymerase-3 subunit alpha